MKRRGSNLLFARVGLRWPAAPTLLAWLLPVFAWAPLAYPGYPELHSGFLPVFNLVDLGAHGSPWGWMPLIGRQFDLLRGEGPLPYLLAAMFGLLGLSPAGAIKLTFAAALVAGSAGMYRWARLRLGRWPALVSAMAYMYWPMGLATVLVRGALAEAVLLALLPWVLFAAQQALLRSNGFSRSGRRATEVATTKGEGATEVATTKGSIYRGAALALGLAAVIWTQAGLGIWLAMLLLGWWLVVLLPKAPVEAQSQASAGTEAGARRWGGGFPLGWASGLVLAAVGLLPTVLRHGWGNSTYVPFDDHFVYPHQLFWPGWGRSPSLPGPDDTLSFSLGLAAFGLVVIALVWPRRRDATGSAASRGKAAGDLLRVVFLVLMASSMAAVLWGPLSFAARTLTYPWQLLLLAGPWWARAAGAGAQRLSEALPRRAGGNQVIPLSAMLLLLIVLSVYSNLRVEPVGAQPPPAPVAVFGRDEIALLRVTTAGAPGPGGKVAVAVEWQALRPLDRDYTVFFHVLGPDGTRYGQQDTMPLNGQLPTSRWRPGQVVSDEYATVLPSDAPVGEGYRYWLGFYDLGTGERLSVGEDDKVELAP